MDGSGREILAWSQAMSPGMSENMRVGRQACTGFVCVRSLELPGLETHTFGLRMMAQYCVYVCGGYHLKFVCWLVAFTLSRKRFHQEMQIDDRIK